MRTISHAKRDLILGIHRQRPDWTAEDIHHRIRYQLRRNDVSLRVVKRVLAN